MDQGSLRGSNASPGKRKLSVAFVSLPQDQELKRTWRGSEHTDWELLLGNEVYRIHKVIVATGEHASHFLAGAFRKHCGNRDSTDLTGLIPQRCWQHFEAVLEFLYMSSAESGSFNLTVENWAAMLKMADLLQIVTLYRKCVEVGADLCTRASAPRLAADTVELQLGPDLEQQVVQMAVDTIAPYFMTYEPRELVVAPIKVLQQLLRRSDLEVLNEDQVFKFLRMISNDFYENPDYPDLWRCLRLQELSHQMILEAAKVDHLPKEAFAAALASRCPAWSSLPAPSPVWECEWVGSGVRGREISFRVQNPLDYQPKRSIRTPLHQLDENFKWSLLIFPMGTESTGNPKQVACFVEMTPEAGVEEPWSCKGLWYEITLVNWKDENRSVTKEHTFTFTNKEVDNGWHRGWVAPELMNSQNGWLNEQGELGFKARISALRLVY